MGADWYSIKGFYGYQIKISDKSSLKRIINTLVKLSEKIDKSFKFVGILSILHSRMEYLSVEEYDEFYSESAIIIGFEPIDDLTKMLKKSQKLKEYITENPILTGIEFVDKPGFYCGIDTMDNLYDIYCNDDEEDEDEEDYEDEEDDADNANDAEDANDANDAADDADAAADDAANDAK